MKIIVGLGNFGDEYVNTFHNMGFCVVECLAKRLNLKFSKRECDSLVAVGSVNSEKLILAKPLTYMNLSGKAVKQLLKKYEATEKDLIVAFDDIDIDRGTVRFRENGSGGTHNGMRNIIEAIGTKEFRRVRVGIGKPERGMLADYVLSQPSKGDRELINAAIEQAADEIQVQIAKDAKKDG